MNTFESLTRFVQGSALVIALTFLVVGHFPSVQLGGQIPAFGIVNAEDELPPLPPIESFYPQNRFLEFGECRVEYMDWGEEWTWLSAAIDWLVGLGWTNNLQTHHPDVYRKEFLDGSDSEQLGPTIYRGFYAQGNSILEWTEKMLAWFFGFGSVIYLKGQMIDKNARNNCSIAREGWEFYPNSSFLTWTGEVNHRFETIRWNQYFLFVRNCQHWAKLVLSGVDTSR